MSDYAPNRIYHCLLSKTLTSPSPSAVKTSCFSCNSFSWKWLRSLWAVSSHWMIHTFPGMIQCLSSYWAVGEEQDAFLLTTEEPLLPAHSIRSSWRMDVRRPTRASTCTHSCTGSPEWCKSEMKWPTGGEKWPLGRSGGGVQPSRHPLE